MARTRRERGEPPRNGPFRDRCGARIFAFDAIPRPPALPYILPIVSGRKGLRPMTEEERKLIAYLFNRLVTLENSPRDPAAEQAIYDGFQQAPNAAYALVQTVLIQDETLKRAEARIRELEEAQAPEAPRDSSFLGSMRQSLGLGEGKRAGSVPSVKPGMSSAWRSTGTPVAPAPEPQQYQAPAAPAAMAA